jgi:VanZ family protein
VTGLDRRHVWRWGPAVAWAAIVLVASLVDPPGAATPATGPLGVLSADKWQHGLGYAVLGGLVARAVNRPTASGLALAVGLAVAFGGCVELLQGVVPARTLSLADAGANAVGALLGVTAWRLARRTLPSR